MSCPDCDCIEIGDVVEHKMNTSVFGIVIGFMGSIVIIRVSPTLDVLQFHEWELQVVDDDEIPPPQSAEQPVPDNVIQVDFTKKRRLRPDTTTEGAA
jgi:hypothetical protein